MIDRFATAGSDQYQRARSCKLEMPPHGVKYSTRHELMRGDVMLERSPDGQVLNDTKGGVLNRN